MGITPPGETGKPPESTLDKRLQELGIATWLISLIGSSTLTGFLATLFQGPAKADVGDGVSFIAAAAGGFALTIGFALGYAALKRGQTTGHPAGVVVVLCMAGGIFASNVLGISAVGLDVVTDFLATSQGSPIGIFLSLVAACFFVYGIIASLQAIVCGLLLGHWLDLIRD